MLACLTVLLVCALSWSVRVDNVAAGSLRLEDVVLCEDLDDSFAPLEGTDVFPGQIKQICLWFEFTRARDGDLLEILWKYEGEDIQREELRAAYHSGSHAFYLLREDGSPLPAGEYSVVIFCNGKMKRTERFTVELSEDSEQPQDDSPPSALELTSSDFITADFFDASSDSKLEAIIEVSADAPK